MADEQAPPSLAPISVAQIDHGISMYLGIFKHAMQAAGKGMKVAAQKAGDFKASVLSSAGRIRDSVSSKVKSPGAKTEKPVTPRQELHIAQGVGQVKQVHTIDAAQKAKLERVTQRLRANNISHINIGAHEELAHEFNQATAISAEQANSQERGR